VGSSGSPFNYLIDGLAKAYELGAPYLKASITIKLKYGNNFFGK
jgi:hypothetical protein